MACELYLEKAVIKKHKPLLPALCAHTVPPHRAQRLSLSEAKGLCICVAPYGLYGAFANLMQWSLACELTGDAGVRKTVLVPVRELTGFPETTQQMT